MNIPAFDALPIVKDLRELKPFNRVYSIKHGVGEVVRLYGTDEIVVHFNSGRKRFSLNEENIRLIPEKHLARLPEKRGITHNGVKMSLKAYKNIMKKERELEKQRKRLKKDLGDSPAVRVKWRMDD